MALTDRALLLDLDRTLVDVESVVDYCRALDELEAAFPHASVAVTPPTTGWGSCTKAVIGILVGLAGTDQYPEAAGLVSRHEMAGAAAATAMPGLGTFLTAVRDVPKAIVTLLGPEATALVIERHGIEVDAVVPRLPHLKPKPFPDQVEEGLRRLGASAETATMIGDSATDLEAARAAGVAFLAVTNGRETDEFGDAPTVTNLAEVGPRL
ncbi:MAG TPA: HAD hydrolase-like protein [Acidimicrobiia bacterium]|jgi:phosphoglycolate phosphatase|nr:HAD hydrolase-like protein [Acidimicrobiia bacterium]